MVDDDLNSGIRNIEEILHRLEKRAQDVPPIKESQPLPITKNPTTTPPVPDGLPEAVRQTGKEPSVKTCPNCKKQVEEDSVFCKYCSARFEVLGGHENHKEEASVTGDVSGAEKKEDAAAPSGQVETRTNVPAPQEIVQVVKKAPVAVPKGGMGTKILFSILLLLSGYFAFVMPSSKENAWGILQGLLQKEDAKAYARCVQLDNDGSISAAWEACNAAVAVSGTSKAGRSAAAKLTRMKPKYDAWKKEYDEKAAADKARALVEANTPGVFKRTLKGFEAAASPNCVFDHTVNISREYDIYGIKKQRHYNCGDADTLIVTDGKAVFQKETVFSLSAFERAMNVDKPAVIAMGALGGYGLGYDTEELPSVEGAKLARVMGEEAVNSPGKKIYSEIWGLSFIAWVEAEDTDMAHVIVMPNKNLQIVLAKKAARTSNSKDTDRQKTNSVASGGKFDKAAAMGVLKKVLVTNGPDRPMIALGYFLSGMLSTANTNGGRFNDTWTAAPKGSSWDISYIMSGYDVSGGYSTTTMAWRIAKSDTAGGYCIQPRNSWGISILRGTVGAFQDPIVIKYLCKGNCDKTIDNDEMRSDMPCFDMERSSSGNYSIAF